MNILRIFFVVVIASAAQAALAGIAVQGWTQADGARVLFVQSSAVPILDVSLAFDAGMRRDPAGKAGTAALTNALLAAGVQAIGALPAMNEAQVSDVFADVGAQRGEEVDADRAGLSLRSLASATERQAALAMLARLAAQPAFPADAVARDRARMVAALREDLTKPEVIAQRALLRRIYGSHPYARQETPESLAALTRDDLVAFHARHYVANRAVVALIGDITRAEAESIAQDLTRALPQGEALPMLPPPPPASAGEERITHPATQSHILIGAPGYMRGDADHFALLVGNYILGGGGFASRLMQEVREKRGLVYDVSSGFAPLAQAGPFEVALQTRKEQANEAAALVRRMLDDFLRDGPRAQEVAGAKANLVASFSLRVDNNRKILDNLAAIGFYRLPLDYLDTWTARVAAVSVAEVRAAFKRKLDGAKMQTVVVGAPE